MNDISNKIVTCINTFLSNHITRNTYIQYYKNNCFDQWSDKWGDIDKFIGDNNILQI